MPSEGPTPATLARVAQVAGPRATVSAVQALSGGTHASTYLVQLANPRLEVVLREFPAGDDAAEREARVLSALDGLGDLAPSLLASDAAATWSERPAVVISRLRGQAQINPRDPRAWARQLGRALVRIHAADGVRLTGLPRLLDIRGGSPESLSGPAASIVRSRWEAIERAPAGLTHYDFWSGNVLWEDDRLSGVVDWSGAATGPAGFDLGWCRLDLYLLFDESIADEFLAAYEVAAGASVPDRPLWDLWAVSRSHGQTEAWASNYRQLGRPDLTAAELRRRHAAWTQRAAMAGR